MATKDKKQNEDQGPVGGLAYLTAVVVTTPLAASLLAICPWIFPQTNMNRALLFFCGGLLGAWAAHRLIFGSLSVFLHELKHSILSNLSGNRAKGMVVNKASGEFRYSYTKETAHMNAFISLAPYCLPLCTMLAIPLSCAFLGMQHPLLPLVVGVSSGLDLTLNLRDISWYQTDLTEVLGGYSLSLWYIIVLNISLWIPVAIFALCGPPGLQLLASGLWQIMAQVMGFHAEPPWSI